MLSLELYYIQIVKKNELYKNPVIRVELPEKIEKIEVNSINLIDEDELKIQRATLKRKYYRNNT